MSTSGILHFPKKEVSSVTLTINARIQAEPKHVTDLINNSLIKTRNAFECDIITESPSAFSPSYPKPTYRFET